jgi:hypothetical protein
MWGFGNSAGVKQLASYQEAKNKFDNTAPIRGRGRDNECRPLGSVRRFTDRTIKKNWRAVDDGGVGQWIVTYSANVWSRDRVEWFPDGKVWVGTGGYSNPTINATVNYSVASSFGEMYSFNGKPYFKTKDGKSYIMTDDGLMLEPTGEEKSEYGGVIAKVMRPTNPRQEHKYRANRKEMNKVRKHYAKFIQYGQAMFSIDTKLPKSDKVGVGSWYYYAFTNRGWNKSVSVDNRGRVFKLIDSFIDSGDLDMAYQAATELGHGFGWNGNCNTQDFINGFTEILKFRFKDSVFTAEPIEIGKAFYDRNAKYFS